MSAADHAVLAHNRFPQLVVLGAMRVIAHATVGADCRRSNEAFGLGAVSGRRLDAAGRCKIDSNHLLPLTARA